MRLIGIGLLAFLIAGLALLLARSEMVGQTWRAARTLTDGPQLRFETPMAAEARVRADQAVILRAGPSAPLILSGLPAYQGVAFNMPIDARPTSGYLQIDATSQVLEGVEGVLRVSIDNTRRAEVLLHPGEAARAVRIELTPTDLAQSRLVVSFSLQGVGGNAHCSSDHGVEAVVEIETTSALFLALDAPLTSVRDRIASWGDQFRLIWDGEADGLLHAVNATRAGAQVLFVPEIGLSGAEAAEALSHRLHSERPEFAWSEAMEPDGDLYGVRRFQRGHTWRIRYDPSSAQNANMPQSIDLSMALPTHPMGAGWEVAVIHDDRLLTHITGDADQTSLREQIPIQPIPGLAHVIEITMSSTFQPEGLCNAGPEILAEILPETRIVPSAARADDPIRDLRNALADQDGVSISVAEAVNTVEATSAIGLLDRLLPFDADVLAHVSASDSDPSITVLPRGAQLSGDDEAGQWLVFEDREGTLTTTPIGSFVGSETPAVALLVQLAGATP